LNESKEEKKGGLRKNAAAREDRAKTLSGGEQSFLISKKGSPTSPENESLSEKERGTARKRGIILLEKTSFQVPALFSKKKFARKNVVSTREARTSPREDPPENGGVPLKKPGEPRGEGKKELLQRKKGERENDGPRPKKEIEPRKRG